MCVCVCEIWVKWIVWQSTRCKNVSITIVIICYFSFAYLLNMLKWTFSFIIVLSKFNGIPSKKICCSYSTYKQLFEIMFASNTGLYRLLKRQSTRELCNRLWDCVCSKTNTGPYYFKQNERVVGNRLESMICMKTRWQLVVAINGAPRRTTSKITCMSNIKKRRHWLATQFFKFRLFWFLYVRLFEKQSVRWQLSDHWRAQDIQMCLDK